MREDEFGGEGESRDLGMATSLKRLSDCLGPWVARATDDGDWLAHEAHVRSGRLPFGGRGRAKVPEVRTFWVPCPVHLF